MKKQLTILAILISALITGNCFAQGVGINNPVPASSAVLDVTSTNKGLLVPRMTSAQRLAIPAPATGLLVYETTTNQFFYFDGTVWKPFSSATSGWNVTGNTGTVAATNFIGTTDAVDFVTKTNSTEKMRVTSGGNVGIGTSTPASLLTVNGEALLQTDNARLILQRTTGPNRIDYNDTQSLIFRSISPANTNANDRVTFTSTGNVGIGTTIPSNKLHIVKSGLSGIAPDVNAVVAIENNSTNYLNILSPSTNENGILFGIGGGSSPSANNGGIIFNNASTKRGFQFRTDGNVTKMVLDSNGKAGIGLTNPLAKLDVFVSATVDTLVYRGRNNSNIGTITQIGSIEKFQDFVNTIDFNGGSNFSINLNNNASHQLQLAVDDAAKPGTNTWTIASDGRLKDDVQTFKDGLETIKQINPVYYRYNGKGGTPVGEYYVGVIAQELQKATPYMVGSFEYTSNSHDVTKRETYLDVNNGALTYVLVNSVKELDAKTEKLSNAVKSITDFGTAEINSGSEVTVNFSDDFTACTQNGKLPVVTVTPVNSTSQVSIKNVTSKGFTVFTNGNSQSLSINWIAAAKISAEQLRVAKSYSTEERQQLLEKVKMKNSTIRTTEEDAEMARRIQSGEIK